MAIQNKGWEMRITEMDLFTGLNLDVMNEIADNCCSEENYAEGTVLFREGSPAENLYILEEGIVSLQIEDGATVYDLSEKSDIFGWSSLVGDAQYTATAVCSSDVKAIRIETGSKMARILNENPEFGLNLYRRLARVFNKRLSKIYKKFLSA